MESVLYTGGIHLHKPLEQLTRWYFYQFLLFLSSAAPPLLFSPFAALVTGALDSPLICLIEVSLRSKLKVTLWYAQRALERASVPTRH